jgi:hypothetical protein
VPGHPFIGSEGSGAARRGGESGGRWWGAIMGHLVRWGGETEGVSGECDAIFERGGDAGAMLAR